MRIVPCAVLFVAACGGSDSIDAPDDCAADELHVIHGSIDERITLTNHSFINKLNDSTPGTFDTFNQDGTTRVHIEFDELTARGATVAARGSVTLASPALDVGNCESGDYTGLFVPHENMWQFELVDLKATDYCAGAAVAEPLRGCYRSE